jgi:MerR-like DNA binding protein
VPGSDGGDCQPEVNPREMGLMAGRRVPTWTVADRCGVPATTLRWRTSASCRSQERSGGQRRYDPDALRRVTFISMAKLPPVEWCTD